MSYPTIQDVIETLEQIIADKELTRAKRQKERSATPIWPARIERHIDHLGIPLNIVKRKAAAEKVKSEEVA